MLIVVTSKSCRCDSDSADLFSAILGGGGGAALNAPPPPTAPPVGFPQLAGGLVIPSPSLPNLSNGFEQLQLNYNLMQTPLASFLSMPSLLRSALIAPQTSMLEPTSMTATEPSGESQYSLSCLTSSSPHSDSRFDTLRSNPAQLSVGGYPSLLKQQLRDIVLRRKSLVREEPEEVSADADRS